MSDCQCPLLPPELHSHMPAFINIRDVAWFIFPYSCKLHSRVGRDSAVFQPFLLSSNRTTSFTQPLHLLPAFQPSILPSFHPSSPFIAQIAIIRVLSHRPRLIPKISRKSSQTRILPKIYTLATQKATSSTEIMTSSKVGKSISMSF